MMHRTARRKRITFYLPAHVDRVLETTAETSGQSKAHIARSALIEVLFRTCSHQPQSAAADHVRR